MKIQKILIMAIVCFIPFFCFADKTEAESFKLWGKQIRSAPGSTTQKYQGNTITLKKTATITNVEGNALEYTIWRVEPGSTNVPGAQVDGPGNTGSGTPPTSLPPGTNLHPDSSATTDLICNINEPAKIAFINAGNSIYFFSSAQSQTGGPLSFNWEFGEYGAEPSTSSQQNPAPVKFNWGGNYKVTLNVTDSAGNRCQSSRHILVYDRNDPREFCEGYAAISIEQNEENKRNNCGYSGGHWHSNEYDHQKWCQSVTLNQARAGLSDRDNKLKNCAGKSAITQPPAPKITDGKPTTTSSGFDVQAGTDTGSTADPAAGNRISHTTSPQSVVKKNTFSCINKDNEEKGCCCFLGAHTYRFTPQHVVSILVQFDTGKRINCRSAVTLEIDRGNGWETIKIVQANSSRNGSELAPTEVLVPVNGTIRGFRISDGCVCCIDSSKITLNPDSQGINIPTKPHTVTIHQKTHEPKISGGRLTTTSSGFDTPTGTVTGSTSPPPIWNQPKYSDNTTGVPCAPDRAFIYSLFQCILERDPGKMELNEQIRDLRQGLLSRKDIVIRFFKSREYGNNNKSGSESYKDAYQAVLGRNPSPDEMRTFPRTYPYLMAMALFNTREYRNLCFPDVGGIKIISATYGGNCGAGDGNVTSHIAQHCDGKTQCRYTVDHKIIGDPVPGCAKTYVVRYRCGNNPRVFEASLRAEAGWGDKAVFLNCEENPEPRPRDYDRDEPASRWPNRDNSFDHYDRPRPVDNRDSHDIHHHYQGSDSSWQQDPARRPDLDDNFDRDNHPGINDSDDNIYNNPSSDRDDEPVNRLGRNDLFDRNDSDDHPKINDSDDNLYHDTGRIGGQPSGGEPGQSDDLDQNRPSLPQLQGVR